jgi:hypothetical protein
MEATRKEQVMHLRSPNAILRILVVGATALALAAPAGARILPVNEHSWGAAATYAKQQTRTAVAADSDARFLAQYGWGAAATYAKLHV